MKLKICSYVHDIQTVIMEISSFLFVAEMGRAESVTIKRKTEAYKTEACFIIEGKNWYTGRSDRILTETLPVVKKSVFREKLSAIDVRAERVESMGSRVRRCSRRFLSCHYQVHRDCCCNAVGMF